MQMFMLRFLVERYYNIVILKPTFTHIHISAYYYVYRTVLSTIIILIVIGMYKIKNDWKCDTCRVVDKLRFSVFIIILSLKGLCNYNGLTSTCSNNLMQI